MMSKIIYNIIWGLLYLVSLLPLKFLYFISDIIAFLLNKVVRYRRTTIDINIARSFPELKYGEFKKLRKEYYRYMCDIAFETIWSITAKEKELCDMITVKNPELLNEICAKHNKIITVLAHSGNWELLFSMCGDSSTRPANSFASHSINFVYKAAENPIFDKIFATIRLGQFKVTKTVGEIIESKRIIRHALKEKTGKHNYFMISDQSPIPGERVVAKFLNQPTLMLIGTEYVATKLNLPVVYLWMRSVARGKYEVEFTLITEGAAKESRGFVTREYAKLLEKDIFTNKFNWLWSHKRWKRDFTPEERAEYNALYNIEE